MRLKALDQIHISSVSRDTIAPGQEFACSDALGAELLKKHPTLLEVVEGAKADGAAPNNKALGGAPSNKSGGADEAPDYTKIRKDDLIALAAERKIDLGDATTKADIIAAIELADEEAKKKIEDEQA
jgi:hypothetical protein